MRTLFFAALVLAAISAPASADTRNITGFDNVNASGNYRVEVAVGPTYGVGVEGRDAARIRTRRDGDTLRIEPVSRPWFGNPHINAVVRVTLPRLEGVAAARGNELSATAGGPCSSFAVNAAMGATIRVRGIECETVNASAAMGAELILAGTCGDLDASAAMGAEVNAEALRCRTVDASAAMGADINAFATASYDASASMGGDISVAGNGQANSSRTALGGAVRD
jgi:hypothetical protein